jgi:hypothetical protein
MSNIAVFIAFVLAQKPNIARYVFGNAVLPAVENIVAPPLSRTEKNRSSASM